MFPCVLIDVEAGRLPLPANTNQSTTTTITTTIQNNGFFNIVKSPLSMFRSINVDCLNP